MKQSIKDKGLSLVDAGFLLVPIKAGEKHPNTRGWPKFRSTKRDVEKWGDSRYYGGFGVLGEFCPGIDIDVSDPDIAKKLLVWCKDNIGPGPIRMGNKPRVLLPCQPPAGKKIGSDASHKFKGSDASPHQIEIKATGRQWVAYGVHPATKTEYAWHNGDLTDVSPDWLPTLTGDKISRLFDYFYSIVPSDWEITKRRAVNPVGVITDAGDIVNADNFENYRAPLDVTTDKVKSMLARIDPRKFEDDESWRKIGMALYHQTSGSQEGLDIFDRWSSKMDNYDKREIEERWPSWKAASYSGNPITFATVVKIYQDTISASTDPTLKKKSSQLSDWERRFALVELPDGSEVHDMGSPIWKSPRRTLAAFREHNGAYTHAVVDPDGNKKFTPMVEAWKNSVNTRHFSGYTYQPGRKRYCTAEFAFDDPSLYINTFFFPPHTEIETDEAQDRVKLFFNFLAHLFPEKEECLWMRGWLARMIQRPDTRSFVTPLNITPITGTGRGLLFEILRRLIGGHNAHDVSREDMEGKFNAYLATCIVAVVQEIKAYTGDHKYQMWEKMKSLLGDSTTNIRAMHTNSYTSTIRANFILFSNNINALPIEDVRERRVYAMRGASTPISSIDVDKLLGWMNDARNIASLFCYLKSYDVDFAAFKRAPVSETKKQMVIASAGEGRADLVQWLNSEAPEVFDFDYALEKLSEYSQDIEGTGITRHSLRHCASDCGWRSQRISVDGRRVYVYYRPNRTGISTIKDKYLKVKADYY